jgi:hypothetical protein
LALIVGLVFSIFAASPAFSKIECRGTSQITSQGPITTPYCQDEEIARVARTYGIKVTGAEIRNEPLRKVYVCQRIGSDVRIKGACGSYAPELYR